MTTITLCSYNIHHAAGMDRRLSVDRIAGVIRDTNADVACLQELDVHAVRTRRLNEPAELARRLSMRAVFAPALRWPLKGLYGNAILTRLPLEFTRMHRLPGGLEPRVLLECHVGAAERRIAVFCTHWGLTGKERQEQARVTAEAVLSAGIPAVLAGDLNEEPDGPAHAILQSAGLKNLHEMILSFPADDPRIAIDHIYGTPGWTADDTHVIPSLASDHRPLVSRLTYEPA